MGGLGGAFLAEAESVIFEFDGAPRKMGGATLLSGELESGADALYKIAGMDNDVIDAHMKTFEIAFEASGTPASAVLSLTAREEGSQIVIYGLSGSNPAMGSTIAATAAASQIHQPVPKTRAKPAVTRKLNE